MSLYPICYKEAIKLHSSLLENEDYSFPLDLIQLIRNYFPEITLLTYNDLQNSIKDSELSFVDGILKNKLKYAFIFKINNKTFIAYDQTQHISILRFSLAHELGHYILEHDTNINIVSKDIENQANCFARNLLSPVRLQNEVLTQGEIMESFGLSPDAAKVRIDLYKTDFWHTKNLYESIGAEMDFLKSKYIEKIEFIDDFKIKFIRIPIY